MKTTISLLSAILFISVLFGCSTAPTHELSQTSTYSNTGKSTGVSKKDGTGYALEGTFGAPVAGTMRGQKYMVQDGGFSQGSQQSTTITAAPNK